MSQYDGRRGLIAKVRFVRIEREIDQRGAGADRAVGLPADWRDAATQIDRALCNQIERGGWRVGENQARLALRGRRDCYVSAESRHIENRRISLSDTVRREASIRHPQDRCVSIAQQLGNGIDNDVSADRGQPYRAIRSVGIHHRIDGAAAAGVRKQVDFCRVNDVCDRDRATRRQIDLTGVDRKHGRHRNVDLPVA